MKNLFFRRFSSSTPSLLSCASFPLKQVTKSNFTSCLNELLALIRKCNFVAVDLEMTGITSSPWRESFDFDSPRVRYLKVKHSAENFAVVQFGLCPFIWDPNRHTYVAYPHNFSLFPGEETFLCQTASLNFLAKYQFDFNNCLHSGITYTSRIQEESSLRLLDHNYEKDENDEPASASMNRVTDIFFSRRMEDQFTQWRDGLTSSGYQSSLKTIFFKGRPALNLNCFTPHQIRILQLVVNKRFKDLELVRAPSENPPDRFIVYVDSQDDRDLLRKELRRDKYEAEKAKIDSDVGFRQVIDFLSSEKKLIVGHNCFLDFAHIYRKFFGYLPQTVEIFASLLNKNFPVIVDTKVLLNSDNLLRVRMKKSSTSLSAAFASLCTNIQRAQDIISKDSGVQIDVQVDDERHSHWNSGVKHEAGYDAFMTGCVFAQSCSIMGVDFFANCECDSKLQNHVNNLYLSWIGGEIINLSNGEFKTESILSKKRCSRVEYDHTVLIWGFPSHLHNKDIKNCITKALGAVSVRCVLCIDETAVLVVFFKGECVGKLIGIKEMFESTHEGALVLHPMWKVFEGGRTCVATYEAYEEICGSSVSEMLFADQAEVSEGMWKVKVKGSKDGFSDVPFEAELIDFDEGKLSADNAC